MADNNPLLNQVEEKEEDEENEDEWLNLANKFQSKADKVSSCCSCLPSWAQCLLISLCVLLFFILFVIVTTIISILFIPAKYMTLVLSMCKSSEEIQQMFDPDSSYSKVPPEVQAQTDKYSDMCVNKGFLANWWYYLKQTHPLLSICTADPNHPFVRSERLVQLFLLQGLAFFSIVYYDRNEEQLDWMGFELGGLKVPARSNFHMFASTLPQYIGVEALMTVGLLSYRNWQVKNDDKQFNTALSKWLLANIFVGVEPEPGADISNFMDELMQKMPTPQDAMSQCWEAIKPGILTGVRLYFSGYMGALGLALFALATIWAIGLEPDQEKGVLTKQKSINQDALQLYLRGSITSWIQFVVLSLFKFGAMWVWQRMPVRAKSPLASLKLPLLGRCAIVRNKGIKVKLNDAKHLANIMSEGGEMKVTYEEFVQFVKTWAEKENIGRMLPAAFQVRIGDEYEYYLDPKKQDLPNPLSVFSAGWIKVRVNGVDGDRLSVTPLEEGTKQQFATAVVKDGVQKTSLRHKEIVVDDNRIRSAFQRLDANSDGLLGQADLMTLAKELNDKLACYRPAKFAF